LIDFDLADYCKKKKKKGFPFILSQEVVDLIDITWLIVARERKMDFTSYQATK